MQLYEFVWFSYMRFAKVSQIIAFVGTHIVLYVPVWKRVFCNDT